MISWAFPYPYRPTTVYPPIRPWDVLRQLDSMEIGVYAAVCRNVGAIWERYIRTAQTLLSKMHHLKPALPLSTAGQHPGMVAAVMHDLGADTVIGWRK
jgi:ribulose 1,5-bisphosphate carboxylase large subunit-like protein